MIWIGVDAHKRVHQGVALGATGLVAQKQIANTATGWAELRAWAAAWPDHMWAIEGSASYGRGLAQFLAELGDRVHEVSPKWTAKRRRTMRKPGKSDRLDAHAVARLLREEGDTLPVVLPEDPEVATLQLWSRLRDELVADMTRVRNRLHALLLLRFRVSAPSAELDDPCGDSCLPAVHGTWAQHGGAGTRTSGSASRHAAGAPR